MNSNNNNESGCKMMKEKNRNAYLLFYERTTYFDDEGQRIEQLIETNQNS